MTRASRPRWRLALLAAALLSLTMFTPSALPRATAQEAGETVTPVTLLVTPGAVANEGQTWIDEAGLHTRDLVIEGEVEGDVSGTATVTLDLDWSGPCESDDQTCSGALDLFGEVEIASEDASWDGLVALEGLGLDNYSVHSILIGRGAAAGRAIVIDALEGEDLTAELTFSGTMVDLGKRRGGGSIQQFACLTGESRADGAFLGSGLIADDGPVNLTLTGVGEPAELGRYGQARHQGKNGTFQATYIEKANGPHAFGSFALAGVNGAYSEVAGFGYTRSTVSENADCQSGYQIVTVWTGEFHFVTSPANFLRPRVAFSSPMNGDRLMNPVVVEAAVENFVLEPAGVAIDGHGHLHLMIEAPCIEPGEPIPEDDAHVHLAEGETSVELNLIPGKYRLCLQLGTGDDIALPYTSVITVTVLSSEGNLSLGALQE